MARKWTGTVLALAVAAVMLMGASVATAALVPTEFDGAIFLDTPGSSLTTACGSGLCPGPYASIAVTTSDTNVKVAHVLFTALTQSGFTYGIDGKNDLVALTISQTANVTVQNIGATALYGSSGALSALVGTDKTFNQVGSYNVTIDSENGGFSNAMKTVFFDIVLDNTTSAVWADAISVIDRTKNAGTWINSTNGATLTNQISWAAAHIGVDPANSQVNGAANTAWAGGAVLTQERVPEPGTLMLLGAGMLLIGGVAARRFKK